MLCASFSSAVTPIKANFILGMDIQGQRLNLYRDCEEGSVTCDNMLLVAPDLGRLLQTKQLGDRQNKLPYAVKLYPAKTKHSLCKDGVTPCRFQGYRFEDNDINGFIDPSNKKITVGSQWTEDNATFSYQENSTYLPLASQAGLIDSLYKTSDKDLNSSYKLVGKDIENVYGQDSLNAFKKDQVRWIRQRSKDCEADSRHQPSTQAEKVCFIQQNDSREQSWFLWID
ncbi:MULTISPECIES: lysozyme inhibitor LprI family protein [Psychrobacter]|uniref:lysozyme inhibitor LprI family protein n=1 Tax=Psychrobacter TaxID=497 RepID=UPI0019188704|nr:lysozyme inhibitor LprI family protein [Psychrobacter immobilis]